MTGTKVIPPKELLEATIGGLSVLVVAGGADGDVLTKQSDGTYVPVTPSAASGDVVGPASATDNAIVRFDSTTGKLVQNSSATIGDNGFLGIGVAADSTYVGNFQAGSTTHFRVANTTSGATILHVDSSGMTFSFSVDGAGGAMSMQPTNTSAFKPFVLTTAGAITIGGNTTSVVPLTVTPASTQVGLVVKAAASQSANLTEWQSSAGAVGACVTSALDFSRLGGGSASEQFGKAASAGGAQSVAVGNTAIAGGLWAVAVGMNAVANTNFSTALGHTAFCNHAGTIVIGSNSQSTAVNQFVAGSNESCSEHVFFGKGPSHATPVNYTIHGTAGSGTNIAGANIYIAGGQGTGTGVGGSVVIQVAPAGASGSSVNALVDVLTIDSTTTNVLINASGSTLIPLTVKAAASQSANLTEWQNSSGAVLASVSAAGYVTFPIGSVATPSINFVGLPTTGFSMDTSAQVLKYCYNANGYMAFDYTGITVSGTAAGSSIGSGYFWNSASTMSAVGIGTRDTGMIRSSAGVVKITNGSTGFGQLTCSTITLADAANITLNTTTGTKIGTATSQKLSLWNATPIVQPTTGVGEATLVSNGGTALTDTDTFDGYTLKQIVKALRNIGALA